MELKVVAQNDDLAPNGSLHLAQHGVSYYVEVRNKNNFERILFGTGSSYLPIKYNAEISNINLRNIDAIVILHCHYDHTGGLYDVLREFDKTLFVHPSIFRENFYLSYKYIGIPKEYRLELMNSKSFVFSIKPLKITKSISMTGEISRENIYGKPEDMFTMENGKIEQDMMDDNSLYIDMGDLMFLISGCSHAGILNIKNYVEKLSEKDVKYITESLHLINTSMERINFTIENLKGINLFLVDCKGDIAFEKIMDACYENVKKIHSGFEVELYGLQNACTGK